MSLAVPLQFNNIQHCPKVVGTEMENTSEDALKGDAMNILSITKLMKSCVIIDYNKTVMLKYNNI